MIHLLIKIFHIREGMKKKKK